jgi:hypothetical protein
MKGVGIMGVINHNIQIVPDEIVFVKVMETGHYEIALVQNSIKDFDVILMGFSDCPETYSTKERAQEVISHFPSCKLLPQREVTVSHKNSVMTKDEAFKIILNL